ncbi:MAG: hypothetical protein ACJAUP_000905 [Cellvibrionaceae bacterium]|jgi:uncharacterized protein YjiS (DUF1127 family)
MQNIQSLHSIQIANSLMFGQDLIKPSLSKVKLFIHRHQTRKLLIALSPEQLHDIGISREQALEEHQKPFWK